MHNTFEFLCQNRRPLGISHRLLVLEYNTLRHLLQVIFSFIQILFDLLRGTVLDSKTYKHFSQVSFAQDSHNHFMDPYYKLHNTYGLLFALSAYSLRWISCPIFSLRDSLCWSCLSSVVWITHADLQLFNPNFFGIIFSFIFTIIHWHQSLCINVLHLVSMIYLVMEVIHLISSTRK